MRLRGGAVIVTSLTPWMILILLQPIPVSGDPTSTPATSQSTTLPSVAATQSVEIQNLIDQLDADDWHTRSSAEDRLVAIGEKARAAVTKLETIGSAEQRTRAPAILARLDAAIAAIPTLITLHLKDANPRDAYAAIAKQSGIEIALFPENLWEPQRGVSFLPVTIDLDQQPFWIALAQLGQLTQSRVQNMNMGGGDKLTVVQGNPGEDYLASPRSGSAQFILQTIQISRNQSVTFAPSVSKTSTGDIRFRLLVDPKITIVRTLFRPVLTEALDDKGNSLLPPDQINQGFREGNALVYDLDSPLTFPNDGFSKLKSLKGKILLTLAGRTEHLDIPDVGASLNKPNSIAAWTITVNTFHVEGRAGTITMKVTVPSCQVVPSSVYSLMNQIRLVDASGHTTQGGSGGSGDGIHYDITRNFNSQTDIRLPISLKWDLATETKDKQIPFEFKDLPLPTP